MTVTASIDTLVSGVVGARDEANLRSVLVGLDAAIGTPDSVAANVPVIVPADITAANTDLAACGASTEATAPLLTDVNARLVTQETFNDQVIVDLGTLGAKINLVITALTAAGLMAVEA